ncbi:MAG: DUF4175 family protein, partial [Rhizobiaceae bacterium]
METDLNNLAPADQARSSNRSGYLVRFWAGLNLLWESFWPLAIPAICVVIAFLTVSWAGIWQWTPDWLRFLLLAAFAGGLIYSLKHLRELKFPSASQVTRRIETASDLEDRPLTAQTDNMAMGTGDSFSDALWNEHRKRMA